MKMFTDIILDRPDKQAVGGGAACGLFSYVLIPFLLYWVSFGFNWDVQFRAAGQMVHHGINFVMALWLFREYLQDSFLNVQMNLGKFLRTVAGSTAAILVVLEGALDPGLQAGGSPCYWSGDERPAHRRGG